MKHGTRDDRRTMIDQALIIFRDSFKPRVWDARKLDSQTYRRLQTGDEGALTPDDFRDKRRTMRRPKLAWAMLQDPLKIIRLLEESTSIRLAVLSTGDEWAECLGALRKARNAWAHHRPISRHLTSQALDSAAQLLRAVGDDAAAEQVLALRWRGLGEWPKDAA